MARIAFCFVALLATLFLTACGDSAPATGTPSQPAAYVLPACSATGADTCDAAAQSCLATCAAGGNAAAGQCQVQCAQEFAACSHGCQPSPIGDTAHRSAVAASYEKCLGAEVTSSPRGQCELKAMACIAEAKGSANNEVLAGCKTEFNVCLRANMSVATGVDVAAEAAFDRCMDADRPNWPGGKPDLSSALPLSIIPAKVNPGMGKTCWVAADPSQQLCGPPPKTCGATLPNVTSSCYIMQGVANCCTFCPASWSAAC